MTLFLTKNRISNKNPSKMHKKTLFKLLVREVQDSPQTI